MDFSGLTLISLWSCLHVCMRCYEFSVIWRSRIYLVIGAYDLCSLLNIMIWQFQSPVKKLYFRNLYEFKTKLTQEIYMEDDCPHRYFFKYWLLSLGWSGPNKSLRRLRKKCISLKALRALIMGQNRTRIHQVMYLDFSTH